LLNSLTLKLTPEQQRHAIDILGQVPELSGLRYQLCPSQIKEIPFWKVYFDLISKIQEPLGKFFFIFNFQKKIKTKT